MLDVSTNKFKVGQLFNGAEDVNLIPLKTMKGDKMVICACTPDPTIFMSKEIATYLKLEYEEGNDRGVTDTLNNLDIREIYFSIGEFVHLNKIEFSDMIKFEDLKIEKQK